MMAKIDIEDEFYYGTLDSPKNISGYEIKNPTNIAMRVCLCCQQEFKSLNKFNRLCRNCRKGTTTPFTDSCYCIEPHIPD